MYYVYLHVRNDTDKVFYVGKGKNKRAYSTQNRNNHWANIVNKYGYKVFIVEYFEAEEDAYKSELAAYQCEEQWISFIGIKNLVNRAENWKGKNRIFSNSSRQQMKFSQKNRYVRENGLALKNANRAKWLKYANNPELSKEVGIRVGISLKKHLNSLTAEERKKRMQSAILKRAEQRIIPLIIGKLHDQHVRLRNRIVGDKKRVKIMRKNDSFNVTKSKKCACLNLSTGEQVVYPSIQEASRVLQIDDSRIRAVIRGERKTAYGFKFSIAD